MVIKWESITDDSGDSLIERSRIDAAQGWLVRTSVRADERSGNSVAGWTIISVVFVPDPNDMWKDE